MVRKRAPTGSLLKRGLRKTYIVNWRNHRGLSQDALASQVEELLGRSFSTSTLSRIENQKGPYSQRHLEALAEALRCSPGDLLMRDPLNDDAPWSLLDGLEPSARAQAISFIRALDTIKRQAS